MLGRESNIDLNKIKKHLSYDPDTGNFHWLVPTSNRVKVGDKAHSKSWSGYYELCFLNQKVYCHRLAWLYVYGSPPNGVIDHINGNRLDNRIKNLRCVSQIENSQNSLTPLKGSKSGVRGVHQNKRGSWIAQITKNGKCYHLGSYKTQDHAYLAYLKAKKILHSAPIMGED